MNMKRSELDLDKYGLSYLKEKHVETWTDSDYERILDAFATEDIAPRVDIPFTPMTVESLLSKSNCKKCAKCCKPNPHNPEHPGVMVREDELKLIGKHSSFSFKQLKRKSRKHETLNSFRYIPLPCLFLKDNKCQIYDTRPRVCRLYPLADYPKDDKVYISIHVGCDYGRELYRSALKLLIDKQQNPASL